MAKMGIDYRGKWVIVARPYSNLTSSTEMKTQIFPIKSPSGFNILLSTNYGMVRGLYSKLLFPSKDRT